MATDSVSFDFSLIDSATGPARKIGASVSGITRVLREASAESNKLALSMKRIESADKMALGVMNNKTALWKEQIRAQNRLDVASLKGSSESIGMGVALGTVLGNVAMKAMEAAVALAKMAASAAVAFAKATIQAAAFGERAEMAIGQLLHGGDAKKELQEVIKIAGDLGLPVQATVKQFQKLLAMQFKPEVAKDMIRMVSDLQAIGAGAEETQRVLLAITQIKAKGRVQAEELLQLAEAGVSTELIFQALAKSTGKTTDELRKLMQAGKITADQGLAAIGEAVKKKTNEKEFGEAGAKFATSTLTGMSQVFSSKLEAMMLDLGKRVLKPLQDALSPIAKDLMAAFNSKEAGAVLDEIANAFGAILGAIKVVYPLVKQFMLGFGEGFGEAWKGMKAAFTGMMEVVGPALKALGVDGSDAGAALRLLGQGIGYMVVTGAAAAAIVMGIVGALMAIPAAAAAAALWVTVKVQELVALVTGKATEFYSAATSLGSNIINGLVAGITGGLSSVVSAITNTAKSAIGAAKNVLQIKSPSKVFEAIGAMTSAGFAGGVEGGAVQAANAVSSVVAPPPQLGAGAAQGGGGGQRGATVLQTIHVNGAGDPVAVANEVARVSIGQLSSALERLALQAAAS